jgi:hypothetical protein
MMNKLIEKFKEQAEIKFEAHPQHMGIDTAVITPEDLEKFAELIVKECCDQLVKEGKAWEQFSRNPPEGQETNTGAALFAAYRLKEDAVSRLEEHFGVE